MPNHTRVYPAVACSLTMHHQQMTGVHRRFVARKSPSAKETMTGTRDVEQGSD